MQIVSDLHLHSRFTQSVSKYMSLEALDVAATKKGIDLLSVGDFTHPVWLKEVKSKLEEKEPGIYGLKGKKNGVRFVLGTELCCAFDQDGQYRKIHILVYLSSFKLVDEICNQLNLRKEDLSFDGRPLINMRVVDLCELVFGVDKNAVIIPAHIWSPLYGVLGANSSFNSLRECFGKYADKICAVETGICSSPEMNWGLEEISNKKLVSFSDAHSANGIGREMTVFEGKGIFNFESFRGSLMDKGKWKISYTVEFPSGESKYFYDGHRRCGIRQNPQKTLKLGRQCPVCGGMMSVGVVGEIKKHKWNEVEVEKVVVNGMSMRKCIDVDMPGFVTLIPLVNVLSEVLEVGINTKILNDTYDHLIEAFGSELGILMTVPIEDIEAEFDQRLGEAIQRLRDGEIDVSPGFDGQYGVVKIWGDEADIIDQIGKGEQMGLF